MARVNPDFVKSIRKYGADDFSACYSCGTCTAICSLTDKDNSFPRKMIRHTMLGLESELKASVDPWLCYYCGDCSTNCPRQADPGNLMMAVRRYLISKYDWTGLSGLLYRNLAGYIIAFLIIIAGIVGLFVSGGFSQEEWMEYGHLFEMLAIGGVFLIIFVPNLLRMWYMIVWKKTKKFDIKTYIVSLKELFVHMFTQKRSLSCDEKKPDRLWWFEHFILVIGYLTLLFTTVFLDWFGSQSLFVIVLGYLVSAIIFIVTFDFVIRRIRKRSQKSSFSHPSDWFFVIWLFMMGFSAFLVRLFIDTGILENHFWMYLLHLTVLVQWALIIVPFGKWTHFLYRSFAMYFSSILALSNNNKSKK
ncbi:MAG TPA: 4Fe-4S dicluster domain-containing protein [Bacteroidales bacterium]|nr:4Fe-4S dicluster domain-containing protein [Bacteroidales bacterium]